MLILVVGPSGAGKDTLMDATRAALGDDPRFRFARREITRPPGPGENHVPVTEAEFAARQNSGAYALSWRAHGLGYGIPADIAGDLAAERVVVANVSRGVIAEAAARFPVRVLEITAPAEVLAARLAGRGRESPAEVATRLARRMTVPEGVELVRVVNDRTPGEAVKLVVAALRKGRGSMRQLQPDNARQDQPDA
ncbi:MAG TPA: phosphonate metabolism protein/1,5-bisphosphokinase (PRPP-forming) PhnN [Acetobacteraceae bacterium]|jgi:phosphonate metabolism protein PhnN/1,5-bisphosphokinase (PRPP-forming)